MEHKPHINIAFRCRPDLVNNLRRASAFINYACVIIDGHSSSLSSVGGSNIWWEKNVLFVIMCVTACVECCVEYTVRPFLLSLITRTLLYTQQNTSDSTTITAKPPTPQLPPSTTDHMHSTPERAPTSRVWRRRLWFGWTALNVCTLVLTRKSCAFATAAAVCGSLSSPVRNRRCRRRRRGTEFCSQPAACHWQWFGV